MTSSLLIKVYVNTNILIQAYAILGLQKVRRIVAKKIKLCLGENEASVVLNVKGQIHTEQYEKLYSLKLPFDVFGGGGQSGGDYR